METMSIREVKKKIIGRENRKREKEKLMVHILVWTARIILLGYTVSSFAKIWKLPFSAEFTFCVCLTCIWLFWAIDEIMLLIYTGFCVYYFLQMNAGIDGIKFTIIVLITCSTLLLPICDWLIVAINRRCQLPTT